MAIFLAILPILSHHTFPIEYVNPADDYLRAIIFMVIGSVLGILSERIAKAEEGLKEYANKLERMVDERAGELKREKKFSADIIAIMFIPPSFYYPTFVFIFFG